MEEPLEITLSKKVSVGYALSVIMRYVSGSFCNFSNKYRESDESGVPVFIVFNNDLEPIYSVDTGIPIKVNNGQRNYLMDSTNKFNLYCLNLDEVDKKIKQITAELEANNL